MERRRLRSSHERDGSAIIWGQMAAAGCARPAQSLAAAGCTGPARRCPPQAEPARGVRRGKPAAQERDVPPRLRLAAAADLVHALAAVEQPQGRKAERSGTLPKSSGGRRSEPIVDRHEHHAVSSQLARSGTARSARAGTCPGRRRVPARELDSGSASGSGFTGAAPRSRRATGTARRGGERSIRLDAWRGASRRQRPPRSRSRSRPGADPGTRRRLPRAPRA